MKGYYRHILLASAVIMAAAGCTKHTEYDTPETDNIIQLSATESGTTKALLNNGSFSATPQTKAMLDGDAFKKDGNRIQIYDYVDGGTTPYINDQIGPDVSGNNYGFTGVWPFVNGPHQWTPGTHKFFGWLAKDATTTDAVNPSTDLPYNTPEGFFGGTTAFNPNSRIYKIAPDNAGLHYDTPQFDFMYSNIETTQPKNTPVELEFYHLFTAFSIGAANNTDSDITILAFELVNLYNSASVNIDYSGSVVGVTYGEYTQVYDYDATTNPTGTQVSHDGQRLYRSLQSSYTLPGGQQAMSDGTNTVGCIFTGSKDREYNLMWPQTDLTKIHSEKVPTEDENGIIVYPSEYMMYIKYAVDGKEIEKRINFLAIPWEAGKKYHFEVTFADKMVDLKVKVNPWEYEEQTIDYSDAVVTVTGNHTLLWDTDTYNPGSDPSLRYAYIKNGMPVEGTFQLATPVGGTWLATLTGDIDAFDIYPSSGVIDDSVATIKVAPKPEALGLQRDFKVKVKFAVRRPDGRTISADSVLQPEGTEYTIILSAN